LNSTLMQASVPAEIGRKALVGLPDVARGMVEDLFGALGHDQLPAVRPHRRLQADLRGQTCISQPRRQHQLGRAKLPAAAVRREQAVCMRDALHSVACLERHAALGARGVQCA
jgi:hypothetical protein